MDIDAIQRRMKEAAKARDMTLPQACLKAGLGASYGYNLDKPTVIRMEAFAWVTGSHAPYLLFGDGDRPGPLPVTEDFEPQRQRIALDEDLGTRIDEAALAWLRWDQKHFTTFLHEMMKLGLHDRILAFDWSDGEFRLIFAGTGYCGTLGDYIVYASGKPVGVGDRDKRFARFVVPAYLESMECPGAVRDICDVVTDETGESQRWVYDRAIFPLDGPLGRRSGVIVVTVPLPPQRALAPLCGP